MSSTYLFSPRLRGLISKIWMHAFCHSGPYYVISLIQCLLNVWASNMNEGELKLRHILLWEICKKGLLIWRNNCVKLCLKIMMRSALTMRETDQKLLYAGYWIVNVKRFGIYIYVYHLLQYFIKAFQTRTFSSLFPKFPWIGKCLMFDHFSFS